MRRIYLIALFIAMVVIVIAFLHFGKKSTLTALTSTIAMKKIPSPIPAKKKEPTYPSQIIGDIKVSIISISRNAQLPNSKILGYDNKGSAIIFLVESLSEPLKATNVLSKASWKDDKGTSTVDYDLLSNSKEVACEKIAEPQPAETLNHCKAFKNSFQWKTSFSREANRVDIYYRLAIPPDKKYTFTFKDVALPSSN
ncbi:MAG: hypothetical protein ACPLPS_04440 [bacterium]